MGGRSAHDWRTASHSLVVRSNLLAAADVDVKVLGVLVVASKRHDPCCTRVSFHLRRDAMHNLEESPRCQFIVRSECRQ